MDDQLVHGHVRAVESSKLLGDLAEPHWMKAFSVDLALDLDAPALGEVLDGAVVDKIAPDAHGPVFLDRLDYVGAVLEAACARDLGLAVQHGLDSVVVGLPPFGPVVGVEAALAKVAGTGVLLDQVGALAEVRHVLGEVTAGLGHESTEM